MKKLVKFSDFVNEGKYTPFYELKDIKTIQKKLKSLGLTSYTPDEKNYKYAEDKAYILTTNAAGDLYGKYVIMLSSNGGNEIKFAPEWTYPKPSKATESDYNENYFLIIPIPDNIDNQTFKDMEDLVTINKYFKLN